MKAVILAAGMGSRLGEYTKDKPKALLSVKNTTLLGRTLNNIKLMNDIEEILIITGYKSEKIKEYVKNEFPDMNIRLKQNDQYNKSNNIYSLHICEDELRDGFMLFNCDIIYDPKILDNISDYTNSFMMVNPNVILDEEEMKVKVEDGKVVEISKKMNPNEGFGEYIGILKFQKNEARLTFEKIRELVEAGEINIYYEDAINKILNNMNVYVKNVNNLACTEIDTEEDYMRVINEIERFN